MDGSLGVIPESHANKLKKERWYKTGCEDGNEFFYKIFREVETEGVQGSSKEGFSVIVTDIRNVWVSFKTHADVEEMFTSSDVSIIYMKGNTDSHLHRLLKREIPGTISVNTRTGFENKIGLKVSFLTGNSSIGFEFICGKASSEIASQTLKDQVFELLLNLTNILHHQVKDLSLELLEKEKKLAENRVKFNRTDSVYYDTHRYGRRYASRPASPILDLSLRSEYYDLNSDILEEKEKSLQSIEVIENSQFGNDNVDENMRVAPPPRSTESSEGNSNSRSGSMENRRSKEDEKSEYKPKGDGSKKRVRTPKKKKMSKRKRRKRENRKKFENYVF